MLETDTAVEVGAPAVSQELRRTIDRCRLAADYLERHAEAIGEFSEESVGYSATTVSASIDWYGQLELQVSRQYVNRPVEPKEPEPDANPVAYAEALTKFAQAQAEYPALLAVYEEKCRVRDADAKRVVRSLLRSLGGRWDKHDNGLQMRFKQDLDEDGMQVQIVVARDSVCERVVTGTRTRTVEARPAVEEHTVEEEIVEWRCSSVLS